MNIKKIKRIGIGFLSVILLSGLAWSVENLQPVNSATAMPLMWEGGTARAMSMGSAVVAVPQGSASLFWNPAGLGLMENSSTGLCALGEGMEIGLHHNTGVAENTQETAVIGIPMGFLGGFAASLNYVNNGTFQGRDSLGNISGDYTAGNMGGSIGWGKRLFRGFLVGAAVKYNKQTMANTSYSAYAGDMGLMWNAFTRFNLGLTYSNLGWKVADSVLDSGWRAGASYELNKKLLLAGSADLKQPDNKFDSIRIGVESSFHPTVTLRFGFVHNYSDQQVVDFNLTGFTAGIGIKLAKNVVFDYGYIPSGDLGISQRLSLTYRFSCMPPPEKPVKAQAPAPVVTVITVPTETPNVVILEKLIILEDTQFEFDSSALNAQGVKTVADNAQTLKENPGAKIRVAGYSSCSGTAEYNQKLSERRAKAVEAELIKAGGIAPERITTIGYGATRPEFEPFCNIIDSKAAKANMRVLFEIQTK